MNLPTLEQLQTLTQMWEEAQQHSTYQNLLQKSIDEADQLEQSKLGKNSTGVDQIRKDVVGNVEVQEQLAGKIGNKLRAQGFVVVADEHIVRLKDKLGHALNDLELEPPWSARNSMSGLYRTGEDVIPLAIRFLDGLRLSKVSRMHFSDCFDLAFCKRSSESKESAVRLQDLKDSGACKIPGVMRHASVDCSRELYAIDKCDHNALIATAELAAEISSYGLLVATLEALRKRNLYIQEKTWITMMGNALRGGDPAVIRQCLRIENEAKKRFITTVEDEKLNGLIRCAVFERVSGIRSKDDRALMVLDYANVNTTDNARLAVLTDALILASMFRYRTIMSKLIEAGADVNATNNKGHTALMMFCTKEDERIVTQLIEAGADINATDEFGETALMYVCRKGHGEIATQLIKAGADINAADMRGMTALMLTRWNGDEGLLNMLIEAGADVNATDIDGQTAYDFMYISRRDSLANRLIVLESLETRANRIMKIIGQDLGNPAVLTVLAGITTAALYASGSLDTALESASQAMPDVVSAATNATSQALTELTTAATEIGHQMGYGPSL
jgi:ankyrin repeat protein